jgi:uncharacterized protein (TIGR03792 family)
MRWPCCSDPETIESRYFRSGQPRNHRLSNQLVYGFSDGIAERTRVEGEPQKLADIRHEALEVLLGRDPVRLNSQQEECLVAVVEHLRLCVPAGGREAWLRAELETWDPWLRQKKGFVEREVLWDRTLEEGVLLIHWATHEDWKAIPEREVAAIQGRFEAAAKRLLALPAESDNPFPLVFAGEVRLS